MNTAPRLTGTLAQALSRAWWVLLLRGLAAIAFGVLIVNRPGLSLATLVLFFGVYSIVNGALGAFSAIFGHTDAENRWLLLGSGLVSFGIGILTLYAPGVTALALLFYIAVWAIASGVLEIAAAIRLRKEIHGELMLALAGLISIAFGVWLIARPGLGALAVLTIIAWFAFAIGILQIALALRVRGMAKKLG